MWLLVEYVDSNFPDYDIVKKKRLIETTYAKKQVIHIRAVSTRNVHRAVIISESEKISRLKVLEEMLLEDHREKQRGKLKDSDNMGPQTNRVISTDSDNNIKCSEKTKQGSKSSDTKPSTSRESRSLSTSSDCSVKCTEKKTEKANGTFPSVINLNSSFDTIACETPERQMINYRNQAKSSTPHARMEPEYTTSSDESETVRSSSSASDIEKDIIRKTKDIEPDVFDVLDMYNRWRIGSSSLNLNGPPENGVGSTQSPSDDEQTKMIKKKFEEVRNSILKVMSMFNILDAEQTNTQADSSTAPLEENNDGVVRENNGYTQPYESATLKMLEAIFPNGSMPRYKNMSEQQCKQVKNVVNKITGQYGVSKQAVRSYIFSVPTDDKPRRGRKPRSRH